MDYGLRMQAKQQSITSSCTELLSQSPFTPLQHHEENLKLLSTQRALIKQIKTFAYENREPYGSFNLLQEMHRKCVTKHRCILNQTINEVHFTKTGEGSRFTIFWFIAPE